MPFPEPLLGEARRSIWVGILSRLDVGYCTGIKARKAKRWHPKKQQFSLLFLCFLISQSVVRDTCIQWYSWFSMAVISVSIWIETIDHEMRKNGNMVHFFFSIKGCWTPFGLSSLCYTQGVKYPWGRKKRWVRPFLTRWQFFWTTAATVFCKLFPP